MTVLAPEATTAVLSARARAHSHRLYRDWGLLELNRKLIGSFGSVVRAGPFQSLSLSPMTHREHLGPFILGTYEEELHPWLKGIVNGHFTQILDVGAKFGYYAVGLSRCLPNTPVVAFDTDWWARQAIQEMLVANQTPDVVVAGYCSAQWLNRHLLPGAFILSDCEGYEGELFAKTSTLAIASATLIVEIHDSLLPGVGEKVRTRFAATHNVSSVVSRPRASADNLEFLTSHEASAATREFRNPQEWLLLTPRGR
ncbi:MAG: hypothetical protein K8U57_23015 [Planctomycetes bacterium]|nr:hypothetical protein [Planctomycetota bacterium]